MAFLGFSDHMSYIFMEIGKNLVHDLSISWDTDIREGKATMSWGYSWRYISCNGT